MTAPVPHRCFTIDTRQWGLFIPLYALRSARNWGSGDLTDMITVIRWMSSLGGKVFGTLPLLSLVWDRAAPSPYSPSSRLSWNEFYLDVEAVPDFATNRRAQARVASRDFQAQLEDLRQTPAVAYKAVMALKQEILALLAQSQPNFSYTHYVRWLMDEQLRRVYEEARGHGVGLYLDLPLGVHPNGEDACRYSDLFVDEISVGAPPDQFLRKGQNWGFQPLDPKRLNDGGYDYFTACLRHHLRFATLLRIDHIMGFHRLYWIPKQTPATDGYYVTYPHAAFYDILCRESRRYQVAIVGEDLGTVAPEVRPAMRHYGVSRTYVWQYERHPDLADIPRDALVTLNTHDMPTFAAFWGDRPDLEGALMRSLHTLAESRAHTLLINLEDLWFERKSQNDPRRAQGNWQHKSKLSIEDLEQDKQIRSILTQVHHWRNP